MKVTIYNQKGEKTGTVELPESIFGKPWNPDLVHQVVTSQEANLRPKVAHVKDRAQVRGGGKKPWRQKGTGRARHGSIRSPLWKGGGVTHGPLTEKNYKKKINKKMARAALFSVLSAKARDQEIVVLDELRFALPKTKLAAQIFQNLAKALPRLTQKNGALIALPGKDETAKKTIRNLPYAGVDEARNLNAREVLRYKYILFPQKSLEIFHKK